MGMTDLMNFVKDLVEMEDKKNNGKILSLIMLKDIIVLHLKTDIFSIILVSLSKRLIIISSDPPCRDGKAKFRDDTL